MVKGLSIAAMAVVLASNGGCSLLARGPKDAKSITFEVENADRSTGEADITYTGSGGQSVTTHVTTPWVSEQVDVQQNQTYRLEAVRTSTSDTNFYCGVHTDTGWTGGSSLRGGKCSYSYPGDIDK